MPLSFVSFSLHPFSLRIALLPSVCPFDAPKSSNVCLLFSWSDFLSFLFPHLFIFASNLCPHLLITRLIQTTLQLSCLLYFQSQFAWFCLLSLYIIYFTLLPVVASFSPPLSLSSCISSLDLPVPSNHFTHFSSTHTSHPSLSFRPLSASLSSSTDPAVWLPADFHWQTDVHRLRGVVRGHAHTHRVAQGRAGDRALFWHHHRHEGVHELSPDIQGVAQTQRQLHLHRQQRRRHRQHGEAAHGHRWERNEREDILNMRVTLRKGLRGKGLFLKK